MAALGDRLGLFNTMAEAYPMTTQELAERGGIHPRYAREWLSLMTSAGYIVYNPRAETFSLPPEHIPVLAQEGGPFFVGGTHQMLLGMLGILDHLQAAFKTGLGIPMEAYNQDTWEGMERDMTGVYQSNLLPNWIPAMPAVQAQLEQGVSLADVGCGSGRIPILLAEAFPKSRFFGFDIFPPVIERARSNAAAAGLETKIEFQTVQPSAPLPGQFDLITTFDVLHDSADPLALLKIIRQALLPGGRYICLEINCAERLEDNLGPLQTVRYGASLLYCMSTSLAHGGAGLGTMGLPEASLRALCQQAGFNQVERITPAEAAHSVFVISAD